MKQVQRRFTVRQLIAFSEDNDCTRVFRLGRGDKWFDIREDDDIQSALWTLPQDYIMTVWEDDGKSDNEFYGELIELHQFLESVGGEMTSIVTEAIERLGYEQ